MIKEIISDPKTPIVIDVTGGRVAISYAISQAAQFAIDYV